MLSARRRTQLFQVMDRRPVDSVHEWSAEFGAFLREGIDGGVDAVAG